MNAPRTARAVARGVRWMGIEPRRVQASVRGLPVYMRNRRAFQEMTSRGTQDFPVGRAYPCLGDRYEESGVASGQYFHQDLLVAQLVQAASPRRHIDVGSRVDGFVAHVASFRHVDVLDIRTLTTSATNITFHQVNASGDVSEFYDSTDSLSCLHALEHFGLGRYGDDLDPHGWRKGFDNLGRMLQDGGRLYLSLPLGRKQRVEFDAHRVFSLPFVLDEMVSGRYRVDAFSYVDDRGDLHRDVPVQGTSAAGSFDLDMGCGIFALTKS